MKNGVIPAIFRIDIEPNEHLQPEAGDDMQEWSGFVDTVEMVETLRGPLADIAGAAFNPNWFVRFDPEIERRYGRADAAFFLHREQFDKLAARQDPIGIHVHLHRWDCEKNVTFSDYGSSAWANYCLEFSSDVYAKCFDQPVRRTSQGGYTGRTGHAEGARANLLVAGRQPNLAQAFPRGGAARAICG